MNLLSWTSVLLGGLVLLQESVVGAAPAEDDRPNILFLFSDDHRFDAVGFMGNEVVRTPALDRLAEQGTVFERTYVTTSVCAISRACVLSGQHMRRHGIRDFDTPFDQDRLRETYPGRLQQAGYYTGFIGKWGVGESIEKTRLGAQVFDYWAGSPHQANYWHEKDCPVVTDDGLSGGKGNLCDCPADSRGVAGADARIGNDNLVDPLHLTTDIVPKHVARFLDTRDEGRPFCLSISFKDPHGPFKDFDPDFKDAYDRQAVLGVDQSIVEQGVENRPAFVGESLGAKTGSIWASKRRALEAQTRNYYRTVATLDHAIGQIREELEARGLAENTVIIYTSDNGMLLGEHGLSGKWLMYEPSVRVPAIIYDPGLSDTERVERSAKLAQVIDFTATILDYAGVAVPESMQGKSLRPLTVDPSLSLHDYIFYEMPDTVHPSVLKTEGLIGDRYKYIRYPDQVPMVEQLFDFKKDPHELSNLAENEDMQTLLEKLRREWMSRAEALR